MKYKIIHLSNSDISGGSSYYAYRVYKYFKNLKNILSKMYVLKKYSSDSDIQLFNYRPNIKFFILSCHISISSLSTAILI